MASQFIPFRPNLNGLFLARFQSKARILVETSLTIDGLEKFVDREVTWATAEVSVNPTQRAVYRASWLLLRDVIRVGWKYRWAQNNLEIAPSTIDGNLDIVSAKDCLRNAMNESRRDKLSESRDFILRMESPHNLAPITALIADGSAVARRLRGVTTIEDKAKQLEELRQTVKPYLQLVREGERCPHTGHKLSDIWRYFRLTWANPAENTPGRTLQYLVRDAALPNHPIMGIAALGNVPLRIEDRDTHIGWTPAAFVNRLEVVPRSSVRGEFERLVAYIDRAIEDIDIRGLCTDKDCASPTTSVVDKLNVIARDSAAERSVRLKEWHDRDDVDSEVDQERSELGNISLAAEEALYRKKRAEQLAALLQSKRLLSQLLDDSRVEDSWRAFVSSEKGNSALRTALLSVKNRYIGTSLLELNVCGAIPPYSDLLGGKLVALSMLSPQVVEDYRDRYSSRPSDIASRLKGSPVIRPSDLVFMGTTSLYSVGSSQYNRLKLPAGLLKPDADEVRWRRLGVTRGYGTFHISRLTLQSLSEVSDEGGYSEVNHVFGEGASPKLRKLRAGLELVFAGAQRRMIDELSRHAMPRLVYGAWLISNREDYLYHGAKPVYYFPVGDDPLKGTEKIMDYWRERWLHMRISSAGVLDRVSRFQASSLLVSKELPGTSVRTFEPIVGEEFQMPSQLTGANLRTFLMNLYRGSSSYSDRIHMDQLGAIHVQTRLDVAVLEALRNGKSVILTGHPGDGKTHLMRVLEEDLSSLPSRPCILLDASTVTSHDLFTMWNEACSAGRPFCAAINQAVLFQLGKEYPGFVQLQQTCNQVTTAISYGTADEAGDDEVVVFDLSLRNALDKNVVTAIIDRFAEERVSQGCQSCPVFRECDYQRHKALLRNETVRQRLQVLLDNVSQMGFHATLRDLQAFVSFLFFGGRSCAELARTSGEPMYSLPALVFCGQGRLFDAMSKAFDPGTVPHPQWDEVLINGETELADWYFDGYAQMGAVDPSNLDQIIQLKRAFYFYHVKGEELFRIADGDAPRFVDLLKRDDRDIIREVLRGLNLFFGDSDSGDELVVWQNHRYGHSPRRICYSSTRRRRNEFEIARPRLRASMAAGFELAVDHVYLRLRGSQDLGLRIDFPLYKMLAQIRRGVPIMFLEESDLTRRVWKFTERLVRSIGNSDDELSVELFDPVSKERLSTRLDLERVQYVKVSERRD